MLHHPHHHGDFITVLADAGDPRMTRTKDLIPVPASPRAAFCCSRIRAAGRLGAGRDREGQGLRPPSHLQLAGDRHDQTRWRANGCARGGIKLLHVPYRGGAGLANGLAPETRRSA